MTFGWDETPKLTLTCAERIDVTGEVTFEGDASVEATLNAPGS